MLALITYLYLKLTWRGGKDSTITRRIPARAYNEIGRCCSEYLHAVNFYRVSFVESACIERYQYPQFCFLDTAEISPLFALLHTPSGLDTSSDPVARLPSCKARACAQTQNAGFSLFFIRMENQASPGTHLAQSVCVVECPRSEY